MEDTMVDTYRTSTAYEEAGTGARGATGGTGYRGGSMQGRSAQDRSMQGRSMQGRGGQQGGDLLEDAIPLVGILLGGALGYFAATALGSSSQGRSPQQGRSSGGYSGASDYGRQSGNVEHDETTDMIASNKVEGTTVYNRQGEKLGEVYNFMVGKRSGRVAYAVMSFGGFLGIGQKYHAVPWNALTYDTSKGGFVIDANRDRLMGAPHYGAGEDPFARPGYGREVQDYWAAGLI
jgi:sporulation protein YlmC with PRC-barrel domain